MAPLCMLGSNETTREENTLSELVEVAFTQRILLAAIQERRGSDSSMGDSSISFHQFLWFASLFMGSISM